MARVTVEDCVERVPNRFELVMMAAQRARLLASGSPLLLDRDNDKNPVVALREIAEDKLSLPQLRNDLIRGHQRVAEQDEPEEEIVELMAGEQSWVIPTASEDEAGEGDEDEEGAAVAAGVEDAADGEEGDMPVADLADEDRI